MAYVLRKHWKCLQHFQDFSVTEVGDPSGVSNDQYFLPRIEFHGMDEQPSKYQTRGICPVQDPAVAAELDAQLDDLIKSNTSVMAEKHSVISFLSFIGTSLHVPPQRVALIGSSSNPQWNDRDVIKRCNLLVN